MTVTAWWSPSLQRLPGIGNVFIGGERRFAMRVWMNRTRMAARGVTVADIAAALRRENIEPPGGRIETGTRELTIRADTKLPDAEAFENLVIRDGPLAQVRLPPELRVEHLGRLELLLDGLALGFVPRHNIGEPQSHPTDVDWFPREQCRLF